jgi:hypothetical protein
MVLSSEEEALLERGLNWIGFKRSRTKSIKTHHKKPQKATKCHKTPQNATKFLWPGSSGKKEVFFVKSFGRDRLIVSNGKTGKCNFVATLSFVLMAQLYLIGTREDHTPHSVVDFSRF